MDCSATSISSSNNSEPNEEEKLRRWYYRQCSSSWTSRDYNRAKRYLSKLVRRKEAVAPPPAATVVDAAASTVDTLSTAANSNNPSASRLQWQLDADEYGCNVDSVSSKRHKVSHCISERDLETIQRDPRLLPKPMFSFQTHYRQQQPFESAADGATTGAVATIQTDAIRTSTPVAAKEQGRRSITSSHLAELSDFLRRHEEKEQQKCLERDRHNHNEQQQRLLLHLIVELYNQLQAPYQQIVLSLLQHPVTSKLTNDSSVFAHDLVQRTCRFYNELVLPTNQNLVASDTATTTTPGAVNPTAFSLTIGMSPLPAPPPLLGTGATAPFTTSSTSPVTATSTPTSPQQVSAMMHYSHAPIASRQLLQAQVDQIATLVQQQQQPQHDPQQLQELDQHLSKLLILARSNNGQSLLDHVPQSFGTESTAATTMLGSSSSTLDSVANHVQPMTPATLMTEPALTMAPCGTPLVQDRSATQDFWQNPNSWVLPPNRAPPTKTTDVTGHGVVDNSGIANCAALTGRRQDDDTDNRIDDEASDSRWLGLGVQNDANDVASVVAV